ncbi:DoxX family protein [Bacillus rugosus]|uniref:DoxX family protein n=1 Tax=Bacillus rugosus TaxID=2715209 RepID=UPI00141E80BD|nr:DoxX family protein [Bacillus rugosus]MEC1550088.1 DoxX family protein [Bacillus rugosus]NUF03971.1 DoxX family protein [Bacillus rugosus]
MISMIMKVSLAAFMLAGGIIKVLRVPFQVEHWRHYQYPLWFLTVTGILEIAGALAMTAGIWNRYAVFGAGVLFVFLMAGAVHGHIVRARQSVLMAIPAMICLIVSIMIIIWEVT